MGSPSTTPWYRRLLALAELAGDITQQDIAERLGISKSAVTGWKEGGTPRPDQVKAAAHAYGVDPLELMRIAYLSDMPTNGESVQAPPKPKRRKPLGPNPGCPPL